MIDNTKEYILCAAIWYDDGKKHIHQPTNVETGFVVCGWRHHNCIATLSILMENRYERAMANRENQGFVTSKNRFVSRTGAWFIAKEQNQFIHTMFDKDMIPNEIGLTSEDIY